jgi:hypothetical protein
LTSWTLPVRSPKAAFCPEPLASVAPRTFLSVALGLRRIAIGLMMMVRTTDGKAALAGQSKANQSKQHRGQAARWDRHNSNVHRRLGQAHRAREGIQNPRPWKSVSCSPMHHQRHKAMPRGVFSRGSSMRMRMDQTTKKHTNVN